MGDAARNLPSPDPVRAEAHALLDRLLDLVRQPVAPPRPPVGGVLPVDTVADMMGWTRRRLRSFCLERGVAVQGTGKRAAVDLDAVRAALAAQPRVRHDAPSTALADDLREAFGRR